LVFLLLVDLGMMNKWQPRIGDKVSIIRDGRIYVGRVMSKVDGGPVMVDICGQEVMVQSEDIYRTLQDAQAGLEVVQ
jgi:hypothetical protein